VDRVVYTMPRKLIGAHDELRAPEILFALAQPAGRTKEVSGENLSGN
jgi:hypothetical protein